MNADTLQPIRNFSETCTRCLACVEVCQLLAHLGLAPGEIGDQLISGQSLGETLALIQRCDLCGLCSQDCPEGLNPAHLMQSCREVLVQRGEINLEVYDVMQVDRDWNFFSLYRSTFEVDYSDLHSSQYDTLFFAGCTLASYAPELTRKIHQWLEGQGMRVGFSEMCCGKPLISIGLEQRTRQLLEVLRIEMKAAGAQRLVTACPNCLHLLGDYFAEFELISLYQLLLDAGIRLAGEERLTIHDSCPSRYDEETVSQVRALLSGHPLVEMEHYGRETICCGSGGIVSMIDPELCTERAERRMSEFEATGAQRCVTACMACAHRLARIPSKGSVAHCLELVFDSPVDYGQIAANTQAMWQGEWGSYNLDRLAQARIGDPKESHDE